MRFLPLAIAAAVLASCDRGAETNQGVPPLQPGSSSGDPVTNGASPGTAPPQAAPAPFATIPAAFHGTYDESREACGRPSQYRLVVGASELRFHESMGVARRVTAAGPNAIDLEADYEGEGETWSNVRRLALSGDRLTISGEGTEAVRIRCPAATPS